MAPVINHKLMINKNRRAGALSFTGASFSEADSLFGPFFSLFSPFFAIY